MASSLITSIEDLPPNLASSVSGDEAAYIAEIRRRGLLPFAVTPHFASLAGPGRDDPIRRQFFPDPREAIPDPFALDDPLGEACHRAAPRLVHQYPDRALLLANGACAGYCRHCFRRVWVARPQGFIADAELTPILAYLRAHGEIREVLVSGGDPLMADDRDLERLFRLLRKSRPGLRLRLCTRVPITDPGRIGEDTIAMLRRIAGEVPQHDAVMLRDTSSQRDVASLRCAVHINHPRELSPETRDTLARITAAGIPVLVQTVLLRGINDSTDVLAELVRECLNLGLIPYYLFQLDLAPGIAHFRVPLKQGLALYRELKEIVGHWLKLPAYAVDLPGGGGKIRLDENALAGERDENGKKVYLLRGPDGKLWLYPADTYPADE
ncbi:lysine 2,3-aminomutase [Spirochaetia bacterium]|nr:lysine 2,3-aminomutase [Spirochaetia bacterium]